MKILSPNTLLQNRYLIVQLVGKGGMGEVYLGIDQRLGSTVALKRTFFADNESLSKAFEREAMILARLRHPVLPKVSDHFTEDEMQYLVMEHIAGDDLAKRLELNNQPFSLNWVLFWGNQLLDALSYLHSHEPPIIHRDIKPQNLKLTPENHVILLDFGLVKNTLGETRFSATGSLSGFTPNYAPMEQIRGTGTTAQSDIYSLSVTLYQLLTNRIPPDALTRADYFINGIEDPVIPVNKLNSGVSKEISDVILKGMSLSIENRYLSAKEMQTAFREALTGKSQVKPSHSLNIAGFIADQPNLPDLPPKIVEETSQSSLIIGENLDAASSLLSKDIINFSEANPDITVQAIHFKGLMNDSQVDDLQIKEKQSEVNTEVLQISELNANEPALTQKRFSKDIHSVDANSKQVLPNKTLVRAAFAGTLGVVLLTAFGLFTMRSTNSTSVTDPTVAPVEQVIEPNIESANSNSIPPNSSAFSTINSANSIDERNSNNVNESFPEVNPIKKPTPAATPKSDDSSLSVKPHSKQPSNRVPHRDPNKVF